MSPRKSSWDKNKSPVGWYVASYIQRFIVLGEKNDDGNRRFLTWENTILVKAKGPEEAYQKAVKEAKLGHRSYTNTDGQRVKWVFEGLTSLLPIYEDLENGCEIVWADHGFRALKTTRKRVKKKKDLEVFGRD